MRKLSKVVGVIAAIVGALSFSAAFAGGLVTGTVQQVLVRASDGLVYAVLSGTPSGKPACATHAYWIIMNEASDAGHKQWAMLVAAQTTGAQVIIYGAGTCTRWADGEDIDQVVVLGQ